MSNEEEQLDKKEIWESFIDGARKALQNNEENYHRKKKDVVAKLAKDLEQQGMPIEMIAHAVVTALSHDCNISEGYILRSIDDKYKREYKKRESDQRSEVDDNKDLEQDASNIKNRLENEDNQKPMLEVSAGGQQTVTQSQPDPEDINNPEKQIFKDININKGNGQVQQHDDRETHERISRLERQNRELHDKLNAEINMTRSLSQQLKDAQPNKHAIQFKVAYMPRTLFDLNHKAMLSAKKCLVFNIEGNKVIEVLNENSGKQTLIDAGIEVTE